MHAVGSAEASFSDQATIRGAGVVIAYCMLKGISDYGPTYTSVGLAMLLGSCMGAWQCQAYLHGKNQALLLAGHTQHLDSGHFQSCCHTQRPQRWVAGQHTRRPWHLPQHPTGLSNARDLVKLRKT